MSIICPACGIALNQITNSHIRSKHPEFNSVSEFKNYFKLDTLWSETIKETFINTMTGKTRDSYILTEKYYEGVKRGSEKRKGIQHWNFGNHWNNAEKQNIGIGVKNSGIFQTAMKKWEDEEYRKWRMTIVNDIMIPAGLKTKVIRGLITAFEDKSAWDQYRSLVDKYTRNSLAYYREIIDPSNLLENADYDLDHRFSKFEGFKKGISPEIIGSVVNLLPLNYIENRQKHTKCSISEEELLSNYLDFAASNKPPKSLKSRKS